MYSPKIREAYIPVIYRLARRRHIRMTTLVNEIIGIELKKGKPSINGKGKRIVPRVRSRTWTRK